MCNNWIYREVGRKPWLVVFANFGVINTAPRTSVKLPTGYQLAHNIPENLPLGSGMSWLYPRLNDRMETLIIFSLCMHLPGGCVVQMWIRDCRVPEREAMDSSGVLFLSRTFWYHQMLRFRPEPCLWRSQGTAAGLFNTVTPRQKLVWYAVCSGVSGAVILNTKVAIVGRGDGAIFTKKKSICPGAGDNNKGRKRWRLPHLPQTQSKFKQSR